MFTKVAAALIAVTVFAAPVLARTASPAHRGHATHAVKVKHVVKHHGVKAHKHVYKHKVKRGKVVTYRKHVKHVRHGRTSKPMVFRGNQASIKLIAPRTN